MMGKHRKDPNRPAPNYGNGYRAAPAEHRFKPGQSGNPKGRPRKQNTVFEEVDDILLEKLAVETNGKQLRLTRQGFILRSIAKVAMKGEVRAAGFLFNLREDYRGSSATVIDPGSLSSADRKLLEDFVRRTQQNETHDDDPDDGSNSDDA